MSRWKPPKNFVNELKKELSPQLDAQQKTTLMAFGIACVAVYVMYTYIYGSLLEWLGWSRMAIYATNAFLVLSGTGMGVMVLGAQKAIEKVAYGKNN